MIEVFHSRRAFLAAMLVACFLTYPDIAKADIDAATTTLKACVAKHLPDERKKSNPNSRKILNVCKQELSALMSLLPPGVEVDVEQLINDDIQKQLK